MKKTNILACSLMIAGCLNFASNAFAETPNTLTFESFGSKQTYTLKTFENDGNKRYEILCNDCCVAQPEQASNLYAFKVFSDANKYVEKIHKAPQNIWHKNINHYNSDGENPDNIVETLATSDSVLEMGLYNGYVHMTYIKSRNKEVMKGATGYDLIGMSPDNVEAIFGSYQTTVVDDVPYLLYCFYIDGGSYYTMKMMLEDGVVAEVQIINDAPGECEQEYGERAYYDGDLPEGWYTYGKVTSINLNVRKEPKTGEVVTKIGTDHPEFLYTETRDTGEEYKWVKIITKMNNGQYADGWVYAKYISPSFPEFNYRNGLIHSMEYFGFLADILPNASSSEESKPDENLNYTKTKKWNELGLEIVTRVYENLDTSLASAELTKGNYAFAGLRVGDSIDVLNKFNENADKAGFKLDDGCKIADDNSITWVDKDESSSLKPVIEIETKAGKIARIKISKE